MKIKTRFSPSPTGLLHMGGVRTALYSWLFARKNNGSFILRIEDTDKNRVKNNSVQDILYGLRYLQLNWDEGPFFQSNRINIYKNIILFMLKKGIAYKCYCSKNRLDKLRKNQILNKKKPKYDNKCRNKNFFLKKSNIPYVIRFKNPTKGLVEFRDMIRGKISISNKELDDLVIQRSNGMPTYNFCVVVDDWQMNITHIIRGEDHIHNTPRQINLLSSLNAYIPQYAHTSMILDKKRKKLSKRCSSYSIINYINNGFIPEAILNYALQLGWSYKNQEIFSINEMKNIFNIKYINKSPSIIDKKKFLWFNHYYLNNISFNLKYKYFFSYCKKNNIFFDKDVNISGVIKDFLGRHSTFKDFIQTYDYFYKEINISNIKNIYLYNKLINITILKFLYKKFNLLNNWDLKNILLIIKESILYFKISFKEIAILIRIVITGKKQTPSISSIIFYIGKKKFLLRIKNFLKYLQLNNSNFSK
ncbi:glutamate--tRNA ligase [Buchnera aphidicola]|uniref:Glutamate--tRNA ligase n=1 Tax=Buchnera aphidicola subsp. Cinara cedri (strain Cc) TaxID=372461 RepID=SYE_BUCCC|nr:glutamate--tRNA ligase [Buchnera aphidicola]Q058C8.1 RecName: Full=Glutamate--tRNA ligase; AltName: Full=Glutamyl-tRNA synthetase; Short=GluRS [Buchnera aphidicola BCc]ABJ90521.1 glutamyl-tRNA synthetase, catalytic subunit [Buchnera aphidicola BCc]